MSRSAAPYHHGNLAAVLETAARELLETHSAADLSLREVARQAGVSHNAPYHHYGDRASLLTSLGVRAMSELLGVQQAAVDDDDDPRAQLMAIGLAYVNYAVEHPNAFALIFDPEICVPGHTSSAMAELIDANQRLLGHLVAQLMPHADERAQAAHAAGLWGTVHGVAQLVTAGHLPREVVRPALESIAQFAAR
jgi:AcrR family transcriptional regulator